MDFVAEQNEECSKKKVVIIGLLFDSWGYYWPSLGFSLFRRRDF